MHGQKQCTSSFKYKHVQNGTLVNRTGSQQIASKKIHSKSRAQTLTLFAHHFYESARLKCEQSLPQSTRADAECTSSAFARGLKPFPLDVAKVVFYSPSRPLAHPGPPGGENKPLLDAHCRPRFFNFVLRPFKTRVQTFSGLGREWIALAIGFNFLSQGFCTVQ